MKIALAVPTAEAARRADFYDHYHALQLPEGTVCVFSHNQSPASGRNKMIDMAVEAGCTHILFLDDDMQPEPDLVLRLAAHNLDIVSGLYLMRTFPHMGVIFDEAYPDGQCKFSFLTPEKTGLIEVVNCGFGCVLINLDVFKKLEKPYVRLGEIFKDEWCDDVGFFNRVRQAGYRIYCDTDARVGHNLNVVIFPKYVDGKWMTEYVDGNGRIVIDQQIPTQEEVQKQIDELVKL